MVVVLLLKEILQKKVSNWMMDLRSLVLRMKAPSLEISNLLKTIRKIYLSLSSNRPSQLINLWCYLKVLKLLLDFTKNSLYFLVLIQVSAIFLIQKSKNLPKKGKILNSLGVLKKILNANASLLLNAGHEQSTTGNSAYQLLGMMLLQRLIMSRFLGGATEISQPRLSKEVFLWLKTTKKWIKKPLRCSWNEK